MSRVPEVKAVELEGDFYHVRFRDPNDFAEIRTPEWATNAAREISDGAKVRMGKRRDGDSWAVQSVLIGKTVGESKSREQAEKIIRKIEE